MNSHEYGNGKPAFSKVDGIPSSGMTLRDYFAALAMHAAVTNSTGADGFTPEERAAWAYAQANAMLEARK